MDATERTVQLSAIMDAPDSSSAWNLRSPVNALWNSCQQIAFSIGYNAS
jgi:hypothetical protein